MKLRDDEFYAIRKKFTAYLNGFEHNPEYTLPDDYFYDHEVESSVVWYGSYRFLLITLLCQDDGGPTMLYLHTDADDLLDIEFASWTFDTQTSVWINNRKEVENNSLK